MLSTFTTNTPKSNNPTANAVYHQIYSKTTLAKQLLESFGPPEIVAHLDLDTLKPEPTKFFSEGNRLREGDLGFQVRGHGAFSETHVAIFIEHQSRFDAIMPLRMIEYVVRYSIHKFEENLQQARKDKHAAVESVPYILPIVLYNGTKPWKGAVKHTNGQLRIDSLSIYPKGGPSSFYETIPRMQSYLIAVHGIPAEKLEQHNHVISWIMQLEREDVYSPTFCRLYQKIKYYQLQSENDGIFTALEALLSYVLYKVHRTIKSFNERQTLPLPEVFTERMMGKLQDLLQRPRAELSPDEKAAYDFYTMVEKNKQEGKEVGWEEIMNRLMFKCLTGNLRKLNLPEAEMEKVEEVAYRIHTEVEKSRKEGKQEGKQEGEQKGKQESAAILLKQRFGEQQGKAILAAILKSSQDLDWEDIFKQIISEDLMSIAHCYGVNDII